MRTETLVRWCSYCGLDLSLSDSPKQGVCDICQGMNHDRFARHWMTQEVEEDAEDQLEELDSKKPSWSVFEQRIKLLRSIDDCEDYHKDIWAAAKAVQAKHPLALVELIKTVQADNELCYEWSRRLRFWQRQAEKLLETADVTDQTN